MSSPFKIAIVGRPNVGKSTLFNRLTQSRAALVSDMPGLTRDRRDQDIELGGHRITLIDTAGLEEAERGSIAARMREQSEAAIHLADLIVFVMDARDGVTPTDQTFAKIARASGKPIVLAANKCEGRAVEETIFEAFELGLGSPIGISAEHGIGLDELEEDILAGLELKPKSFKDRDLGEGDLPATMRPLRVAIVGRPNAGKSTLVNAFLGEDRMITGPEPGLTRDSIASDLQIGEHKIRLYDTAGLRRKSKVEGVAEKLSASDSIRAIRFAEVVVMMIDAERAFEQQDLIIAERVAKEGRALVIAINKWDLVEEKQQFLKDVKDLMKRKLSQVPNVSLVPISALAERGMDKLAKAIFQTYENWNKRVGTPALNRWLQSATTRHAPPAVGGRRIKLRFATQPSVRPPTFVVFCSRPQDMPKSYIRYLTNDLRDAFDLPGVPIRLNLRKGDNPFAPKSKR
ncbi:MAG: ribosome biogenesis GTPase Der [Hyphomicrobiaceae bacterium]